MIVDALVAFGYPFSDLRKMTYTELADWLDVAVKRVRNNGA